MRVDNDECSWISRTSDLELELGVVLVEDLVGNTSTVDAAEDLHVSVTIGLREVSGEAAIVWDGERQLEESRWNIITPHLEAVEVATMDSCSEDGIDSEQEEVWQRTLSQCWQEGEWLPLHRVLLTCVRTSCLGGT